MFSISEDIHKTINGVIKGFRSQEEFAQLTGLKRSAIGHYVTGKRKTLTPEAYQGMKPFIRQPLLKLLCGAKIKKARLKKELSLEDLANKLSIKIAQLEVLEEGQALPTASHLKAFHKQFSLDDILPPAHSLPLFFEKAGIPCLHDIRRKAVLSQRELSGLTGIDERALYNLEQKDSTRQPKGKELQSIANAFNILPYELFVGICVSTLKVNREVTELTRLKDMPEHIQDIMKFLHLYSEEEQKEMIKAFIMAHSLKG